MASDDVFNEQDEVSSQHSEDFSFHDREGLFDAQLTFPDPSVKAPRSVGTLVKRDGRHEPFDKAKIADGIRRASIEAGDTAHDRATYLASAVSVYLSKHGSQEPATSQQVAEALERVLVEMGHARTAQRFAAFRERRARLRRLHSGRREALATQLANARQEPKDTHTGLLVRTSTERLAEWDRDKIAEALIRETGLERDMAQRIALEVERQISAAGVTTFTTPLVRELVNAKLIEHGFEEHARRHMRLGVPLYDADRIIGGLNAEGAPLDPDATGRTLAESIKREFALSQVFSPDVAEAHLSGDMHLHDLPCIDRFLSVRPSPGTVSRLGIGLPGTSAMARAPRFADAFLAQMVNFGAALTNHFSGDIHWDAVNYHFAPFLDGFTDSALRQLAQMLVYEFACRAVTLGERAGHAGVGLSWEPPAHLKVADAIGPEGAPSGKTYGDYAHSAQRFAAAIIDVLREGAKRGTPFLAPIPRLYVTPAFFRTEGHEEFLERVTDAVAAGVHTRFALGRENLLMDGLEPWAARDLIVHQVTLNLPRAAAKTKNWTGFSKELTRLVEMAARAHAQKRDLIERLLALKNLGPLSLLCAQCEGHPVFDIHRATYIVGITGLDECVYLLTGHHLSIDGDTQPAGERVLTEIAEYCREWSERLDLLLVPGPVLDPAAAARFALLDSDTFPETTAAVLASASEESDVTYTPGVSLPPGDDTIPMECTRLEGLFHEIAPANAVTAVRVPHADASGRAITDFIRKVYRQTTCRQIVFSE